MKTIGRVILFILLVFMVIVFNTLPVTAIAFLTSTQQWFFLVFYALLLIYLFNLLAKRYSLKTKNYFKSLTKKDWIWNFGIFFVLRIVAIIGTALLTKVYGTDMSANDTAINDLMVGLQSAPIISNLLFLMSGAVIAPFFEELVFRGFGTLLLFNGTFGWIQATIISAIFSLLHISNVGEFILYFILGLGFYIAYRRRHRLEDAIMVHFLNNSGLIFAFLYSYLTK